MNQETSHDLNDLAINEPKRKSVWKFMLKAALLLTLGLGVFFATQWAYEPSWYRVIGTSMFPNLLDGDTCLIVNRDLGTYVEVKHNDIVVLEDNQGEKFLVKRVVGLPGDTIEFRAGRLLINDKTEDNLSLLLNMTIGAPGVRKLGANEYFVLGDNRKNSSDSRSFGPITREKIQGVVILRWRSLTVR